jgi:catechol 2,3-dioxygenase-like lactoylglutathione lyase family enzyme
VPSVTFDHIALAIPRMADAPEFLVGVLGGIPSFGSDSGVYRFGQWMYEGGGRLEVLEPIGDDGFLHRFLATRGPGIHHVTFKVPSLGAACERARARGYAIVGFDDSNPHWKEAFLHPREALGIVVQFAESSGAPPPHRWRPPAAPPHPPPPVTILGLRTRARSVERAQRQWGEVLTGSATAGTIGEVIYRWPESPMTIAVEIDPAADEGPVTIDIVATRPLSVPEAPHPVLGARFSRC